MRLVILALIASTAGAIALLDAQAPPPLYRQSSASVETRVADLLARMTLEEKVAQKRSSGRVLERWRGQARSPGRTPAVPSDRQASTRDS